MVIEDDNVDSTHSGTALCRVSIKFKIKPNHYSVLSYIVIVSGDKLCDFHIDFENLFGMEKGFFSNQKPYLSNQKLILEVTATTGWWQQQ